MRGTGRRQGRPPREDRNATAATEAGSGAPGPAVVAFMIARQQQPAAYSWVFLQRPCGCGQPVVVESNNPGLARLLEQGYRIVGYR